MQRSGAAAAGAAEFVWFGPSLLVYNSFHSAQNISTDNQTVSMFPPVDLSILRLPETLCVFASERK